MGWQQAGLVVGVMAGHLLLQLRYRGSAIVADSNTSYCQMLLSRDTVVRDSSALPPNPTAPTPPHD
jgi:hypothetical protein